MPTIVSIAGLVLLPGLALATYRWFGIAPAFLVAGVGIPAYLAWLYYLIDLEGRKGGRGWPTPKELRLLVGDPKRASDTTSNTSRRD
ncbi:hypothetical protein [Mesorhizobium sp. CN2-181]|uniref:hypothetical protein n=1 Tax=Mesorhizobium yinganensis TaxID=3157707 RepID=UPI0032B832E3